MSKDYERDAPPATDLEQLAGILAEGEKSPSDQRVGIEIEKLPYWRATSAPVEYEGGVRRVLEGLVPSGWRPILEAGVPIALERAGASVSLEPGGQIELSGAPRSSVHAVAAEVREHERALVSVGDALGIGFATWGFRPFETPSEVPWMPKERYRLMRGYLPRRGDRALEMMQLSATVQANFDYVSEADMVEKMRAAMGISPIVAAMFANSPFERGRWLGRRSRRYAMWRDVDPDRSGLLPFVFDEGFGYRRYVEWAVRAPMFFIRRAGQYVDVRGLTFERFMRDGYNGERASLADFESALSMLFPEVRLKRHLEVRGADSAPIPMALGLVAFWKGILYDDVARRAAIALTRDFTFTEREAQQLKAAQEGLAGHGARWHLGELARELVRHARAGLVRQDVQDDAGRNEAMFLAPLEEVVTTGETLADRAVRRFGAGPWDDKTRAELMALGAWGTS